MDRRGFLGALAAVALVPPALTQPQKLVVQPKALTLSGCELEHKVIEKWIHEPSDMCEIIGWKSGRCSGCGSIYLVGQRRWLTYTSRLHLDTVARKGVGSL
jgi:hypothetical protein